MFSYGEENSNDQYQESSTSKDFNNVNNNNDDDDDKKYESKIMVLDDDFDIATVVREVLRRNGYRNISMFTEPSIAIREFGENGNGYALVISDIRMPGMNGFDLAKHIGKINPEIKVILMTAFEVNDDLLSMNAKHDEIKCITQIIEKPISTKKLAKIVSELY